ncbi:hypothetical protein KAR48_04130, partial [bacterium]|nr:hypothetical protein [bacterium]
HSHRDHKDHGAAQPAPKDIDEFRWCLDETAAVAWKRRLPRRDGVKFECVIARRSVPWQSPCAILV